MDEESRMRDYYRTDRDPEEHEITKCEKYHYHPTGLGRIADPNYKHPGDTLHAPTTGSNYVYHIKAEFMMGDGETATLGPEHWEYCPACSGADGGTCILDRIEIEPIKIGPFERSPLGEDVDLCSYQEKIPVKGHGIDIDKMFGGKHFDEDKLRYDLLPPEGEEAIAEVLTYGAKKYGDRNWEEGISFTKIYGSIRRHLAAWYKGEDINVESGLNHLSHAACNLFFLIYYIKNNRKELDDRP
jgi:hypothetical protein